MRGKGFHLAPSMMSSYNYWQLISNETRTLFTELYCRRERRKVICKGRLILPIKKSYVWFPEPWWIHVDFGNVLIRPRIPFETIIFPGLWMIKEKHMMTPSKRLLMVRMMMSLYLINWVLRIDMDQEFGVLVNRIKVQIKLIT